MKGIFTKLAVFSIAVIAVISFSTNNNFFFTIKSKIPKLNQNSNILKIKAENNILKAEVASLKNGGLKIIEENYNNKISSTIFSNYPFNDKSRLTISLNEESTPISVGDIIIIDNNLVGQVLNSYGKYATIKTVFDPSWEFPVYIGPQLTRGLFKAGIEPKVVLISKKEKINPSDVIVSADPNNIPFRLIVGQVGQVVGDDSSPFWEVSVNLPYSLNELRQVFVLKNERKL